LCPVVVRRVILLVEIERSCVHHNALMRMHAIGGRSPLDGCLGLIKAGADIAAACVRVIA
jgi:hypothetical protein